MNSIYRFLEKSGLIYLWLQMGLLLVIRYFISPRLEKIRFFSWPMLAIIFLMTIVVVFIQVGSSKLRAYHFSLFEKGERLTNYPLPMSFIYLTFVVLAFFPLIIVPRPANLTIFLTIIILITYSWWGEFNDEKRN